MSSIEKLLDKLSEAVELIRSAHWIGALTGSGISAESGIPTFREAQTGLWSQYDPQQLATPEAFDRNPELIWHWYAWRRQLIGNAEPNPGHNALVKLQNYAPNFSLITQNIDGLHQAAGSRRVIELHGNIHRTKCTNGHFPARQHEIDFENPPACRECGALLRPDVVWFGESLPQTEMAQALNISRNCDVFLSIGTSSLVQPAASLPYEAVVQGARTIEVNLGPTPFSPYADLVLEGPAGVILPALIERLHP